MKSEACHPCLCSSVRQLSRVLTQIYDDALRPSGLRSTQFLILMTLQGFGEARLNQLEAMLDIDQTTLTRSITRMESDRLLQRVNSDDQRERRIQLTPKGSKTLERAKPLWEAVQAEMQSRLGDRVWNEFRKDLAKVRRAVTAEVSRSAGR
jgi:DNA-binding MarR family transcriptional regulator